MRYLVLILGLMISACQTDQAIRDNLPSICKNAETAHAAFVAFAAGGQVSSSLIRKEAIAWNSLQPLCENPQEATTASVLIAAASAYATIRIARDAARNQEVISK